MQFGLFLLVNALLFIRPGDMIPELSDVQLYYYAIVACLLVSLPNVVQLFARVAPTARPILLCVLGLTPAVFFSHMCRFQPDHAVEDTVEFVKVVVYFLLFLALVNTPTRLRQLLVSLGVFSALLALVSVVNYHAAGDEVAPVTFTTEVQNGQEREEKQFGTVLQDNMVDPVTGEMVHINRLCGVGIFKDPNDLGLALVVGLLISLYWAGRSDQGVSRLLALPFIGLFGYSLALTHSRGGFLALVGGLGAFFYARFGWRKSLLLGALALPVLLVFFGGRMTDISTSEGTGQSRIQLWSDGLALLQESPLFGIGMGNYRQRLAFVAHNSYLHCFTELGVLGGTLFLGAFSLAARMLFRYRQQVQPLGVNSQSFLARSHMSQVNPGTGETELRRLYPLIFAVLVAYMTGILFLSRSYVVPTYTILGMATTYLAMAEPFAPLIQPRWKIRAVVHLAGASLGFLGSFFVLVRFMLHWG